MAEEIAARAIELEEETQYRVSDSLSKIEVALADWEACQKKPKGSEGRVERLRASHALLSEWEKKSLRGKKDFVSTIRRLQNFTEICTMLKKMEGA